MLHRCCRADSCQISVLNDRIQFKVKDSSVCRCLGVISLLHWIFFFDSCRHNVLTFGLFLNINSNYVEACKLQKQAKTNLALNHSAHTIHHFSSLQCCSQMAARLGRGFSRCIVHSELHCCTAFIAAKG